MGMRMNKRAAGDPFNHFPDADPRTFDPYVIEGEGTPNVRGSFNAEFGSGAKHMTAAPGSKEIPVESWRQFQDGLNGGSKI